MGINIIGPEVVEQHKVNLGSWASSQSGQRSTQDLENLIERINNCGDVGEAIQILLLKSVEDATRIYRLTAELAELRDRLPKS